MTELLRAEVAVIGAGAAGAMAAVAAAKAGAAVVLVQGPPGATALSSGAVDLAGEQSRGAAISVAESLARSLQVSPRQPLATLGRAVTSQLAEEVLSALCRRSRLYPARGLERLQALVPSALGHLHPCWLRQTAQADLRTLSGQRLGVVDAPGGTLPALLICHQLEASAASFGVDATFLPLPVELPYGLDPGQPLLLARRLDRDEGALDRLGRALADALAGQPVDVLLIPPWAGLEDSPRVVLALEERVGMPVREILGRPGDPPGLRLYRLLEQITEAEGVERLSGKAVEALVKDERVVGIQVQGRGEPVNVEAAAFVLATGGLAGGGFVLGQTLREGLLELPLTLGGRPFEPPSSLHGADRARLFTSSLGEPHPALRVGVPFDGALHVVRRGLPLYPNLHVAGAMLADHDPIEGRSGLATAMITGWLAGVTAAKSGESISAE